MVHSGVQPDILSGSLLIERGVNMKRIMNSTYLKWGLTAFAVIAGSICFFYLIFHASTLSAAMVKFLRLLMPLLFGFGIAYLLTPVLNFTEQRILSPLADKIKIRESSKRNRLVRGIGIILTCCFVVAAVYLIFAMLISQIVPSIRNIASNADAYIENLVEWVQNLIKENPSFSGYANELFQEYSSELENWFNDTALDKIGALIKTLSFGIFNTMNVLWKFIVGFVISVYVLASKERFAGQAKKIAYAVFERDTASAVIRNFRFTHKTFIGFMSGKILDSFIIGILCFAGTSIIGTPYAALVSVVIGVTNVIPFFGPFIGAIPCGILIFVVDPMHPLNCLYFVLFIFALQQFDGNILGPKILGDSTGLSGFWVIFAITLFGGLLGVPGMIIGVPVFAVIYAAVRTLVNSALGDKKMARETEKYVQLDYVGSDGVYHQNTGRG